MTNKLKKQLILNLPYLIFVYLFDKLCQGVRLAPGADASEKLLHIGQGFSAAFASLAPSFHLVDLCVGAAGAVLIRLAVYSKGKNAKKYRKGMEYDKLGEYESLDELNYLASKLDEMSQGEYEQFQAAMEIGDHSGSLQEIINLTENLDCYDIYPDIHDHDPGPVLHRGAGRHAGAGAPAELHRL